jgi:hypothetical protein
MVDAAEQGGFPRATGPQNDDHLAFRNIEIDALENLVLAEALVDVG